MKDLLSQMRNERNNDPINQMRDLMARDKATVKLWACGMCEYSDSVVSRLLAHRKAKHPGQQPICPER